MLVAEGIGTHIDKGYIYFAMAFSLLVEMLNMRYRKKREPAPEGRADPRGAPTRRRVDGHRPGVEGVPPRAGVARRRLREVPLRPVPLVRLLHRVRRGEVLVPLGQLHQPLVVPVQHPDLVSVRSSTLISRLLAPWSAATISLSFRWTACESLFCERWMRKTIRNVTMVVPVLMTSCQVSENPKTGRSPPTRGSWRGRRANAHELPVHSVTPPASPSSASLIPSLGRSSLVIAHPFPGRYRFRLVFVARRALPLSRALARYARNRTAVTGADASMGRPSR